MGRLDTSRRRRISHGARRLPAEVTMNRPQYEPLAQIEVDAARPEPQGFTLTGQGPDHAEYQLDLRFEDRKSTRLNSSHSQISYAVFCLKKKKKTPTRAKVITLLIAHIIILSTLLS